MAETVRGVNALQNELEKAKESLKDVDENIKKLTGRDPTIQRAAPGQRRVALGTADRGGRTGGAEGRLFNLARRGIIQEDSPSPVKRRNPAGGAFARLGPAPPQRRGDQRRGRGGGHDSGEEDDLPNKPSLQSSVTAASREERSRQNSIEEQSRDRKGQARNRRMFGLLLGTLQKFKDDAAVSKDKEEQRQKIEKKLEEKFKQEKEDIIRERRQLFLERRKKQLRIRLIEQKMEMAQNHEDWERETRKLENFIITKSKPCLFYLPKIITEDTEAKLAETREAIAGMIEMRRKKLEEEISEMMNAVHDIDDNMDEGESGGEDENDDDDADDIRTDKRHEDKENDERERSVRMKREREGGEEDRERGEDGGGEEDEDEDSDKNDLDEEREKRDRERIQRDRDRQIRDKARDGRKYRERSGERGKEGADRPRERRDSDKEARDKSREGRDKSREARDKSREGRDKSWEGRDKSREGRDKSQDKSRERRDKDRERDASGGRKERDRHRDKGHRRGHSRSRSRDRDRHRSGKSRSDRKRDHSDDEKSRGHSSAKSKRRSRGEGRAEKREKVWEPMEDEVEEEFVGGSRDTEKSGSIASKMLEMAGMTRAMREAQAAEEDKLEAPETDRDVEQPLGIDIGLEDIPHPPASGGGVSGQDVDNGEVGEEAEISNQVEPDQP